MNDTRVIRERYEQWPDGDPIRRDVLALADRIEELESALEPIRRIWVTTPAGNMPPSINESWLFPVMNLLSSRATDPSFSHPPEVKK